MGNVLSIRKKKSKRNKSLGPTTSSVLDFETTNGTVYLFFYVTRNFKSKESSFVQSTGVSRGSSTLLVRMVYGLSCRDPTTGFRDN